MATANPELKEKVRALVRDVLAAVPAEVKDAAPVTEHVVVNSLKAKAEREWDRDESSRSLITEDDLRHLEPGSRVRVSAEVRFTPLAADIVSARNIRLVTKEARDAGLRITTVAIGADHGGFELKEQLKGYLSDLGLKVRDFGTGSTEPVDYPDLAHAVAKAVSSKQADAGILIDGAGIGSAMAANKVPGIRAAACYSVQLARNAREHNAANVLTIGSGQNRFDEVKAIVEAFCTSEIKEIRHKNRVAKIESIDREYRK